MFISFIFASLCFPVPLSLPIDSQSHILSVLTFSAHGDDDEASFLIHSNLVIILFFVSIDCDNLLLCVIKHRTTSSKNTSWVEVNEGSWVLS